METIPKMETLDPITPAKMVNSILVPDLASLSGFVGKPFFQELVPFHVHQAASKYTSKKQTLVKELTDKLNESTSIAHS